MRRSDVRSVPRPTVDVHTRVLVIAVCVAGCSAAETSKVGAACAAASECGDGGVCLTRPTFPGGYCSSDCGGTGCDSSSACVRVGGTSACYQRCRPGTRSCREGYECVQLAGTTSREIIEKSRGGVCLTKAFIDEALDGGERPEGKLGDACLLGELVTGCIAPLFCDSTPGLRGGYCTRVCGDDGECGDGFCSCGAGFCAGTFNPTGFCFASCFGLGTQSTCRPGYLCTEFDLAGDQGACLPE